MDKLIHRENYLATNRFLDYLRKRVGNKSLERYRFYLRHLLLWAMDTPLYNAKKIPVDFPTHVANTKSPSGKLLAHETQKKIFDLARKFFTWAKMEYPSQYTKTKIEVSWIDDLREIKSFTIIKERHEIDPDLLNDKGNKADINIQYVRLDDVIALANLPVDKTDLAYWRDCAMATFLFLTGARANAAVSIPIGAVHFDLLKIRQWTALGVRTKNGKSATTFMHKIPELIEVAQSWDSFVQQSPDKTLPWYAPVHNEWGEQRLSIESPIGKNRGVALNKRLRLLFAKAGLPYQSAHAFRHGHAIYGLERCRTMADYKAQSLNLMHETLTITDSFYVHMLNKDIGARIHAMTLEAIREPTSDTQAFLSSLSDEGKKDAFIFLSNYMAHRT